MVLTEIDRGLLERCLKGKPRAWEDFVDRFLGLVVHVVNHTTQIRGVWVSLEDRDDLVSEVFLGILRDDFAVLRRFRGQSSLATYLTVVARRIVVHILTRQRPEPADEYRAPDGLNDLWGDEAGKARATLEDRDQVERLLGDLGGDEAAAVRMYHLQGKSYREISSEMGVPENSIGPLLNPKKDAPRWHESRPRLTPGADTPTVFARRRPESIGHAGPWSRSPPSDIIDERTGTMPPGILSCAPGSLRNSITAS